MTKPDPKQQQKAADLAKLLAKRYSIPLPKVAQIFQKYAIDQAGLQKSRDEIMLLVKKDMDDALGKALPFYKP